MKNKISLFIVITLCIISCNEAYNTRKAEGFKDNILRVYIYEFIPEHDNYTDEKFMEILKQRLNDRAFKILACHVSINLKREKISSVNDTLLNSTVNTIISAGKIINFECYDNGYCEAAAEYNVEGLYKLLDSLNSN